MLRRRASLIVWGAIAVGLLAAAGLIVHRLGREREARRRNNVVIGLVEADHRNGLQPAIAELEAALRLRPSYTTARYNLGLTRFRANDLAGARKDLEAVLHDDPDHVWARYEVRPAGGRSRGSARKPMGHGEEVALSFAEVGPLPESSTAERRRAMR